MFRILKCDKDSYITNKIIRATNSTNSRSTDANTGQAGTIDLYKLYNETVVSGSSGSGVELTRAFLHFDLSPLLALTSSVLDITNPTFKCYLQMFDIYGGQTTPSNYTLNVFPLAKTFSEGRGSDVVGYRDLDAVNWTTASIVDGVTTLWTITGSQATGSSGATGVDYYVSGTLSIGYVPLGASQSFSRGDEDLSMDITTLVSATIAGILPDYGYRLSFVDSQERDGVTRFVKRFASRHSSNNFQHPRIVVKYDDRFFDNQLAAAFDVTNTIGMYNTYLGNYRNFFSGSTAVTGANCLMYELHASKSVTTWTSSWSATHSQSINVLTSSYVYFSTSFTGSQRSVGNNFLSGVYYVSATINLASASLQTYLGSDDSVEFTSLWKSLDGTVLYSSGSKLTMNKILGKNSNVAERNFVVNIENLKQSYTKDELARFRVFVQDYNTDLRVYFFPLDPVSEIYQTTHWRLLHAYTREVLIPFDLTGNSTALSADGHGMYFDIYMNDLEVDQVYELEFLIRENGQDYITTNQGFRFRVMN